MTDQPPSSETLTEEQQIMSGQILWNEDWLASRIWMAVFNTSNAYHGGPVLSWGEWRPTWTDKLSECEREMWKAAARLVQPMFQRLVDVERIESRAEIAALREDHVALANVSGALCDAGGIVPAEAWRYGEAVRAIVAERDEARAALAAALAGE